MFLITIVVVETGLSGFICQNSFNYVLKTGEFYCVYNKQMSKKLIKNKIPNKL